MLPTPSTSHVSFDTIYEPAEDSYLLLDTLSSTSEATWLKSRFHVSDPSPFIVEVGTGSGVVLAFVSAHAQAILGRMDTLTLGVDVNPNACKATAKTVSLAIDEQKASTTFLGCIQADLTTASQGKSVDVLIFNPPYVPSEDVPAILRSFDDSKGGQFERESHLLALSYAGGMDGMEVTERLLSSLPSILSRRGVAYILFCRQNRPEVVKARIREWERESYGNHELKWNAETVGHSGKQAGWEKLEIVRIWKDEV